MTFKICLVVMLLSPRIHGFLFGRFSSFRNVLSPNIVQNTVSTATVPPKYRTFLPVKADVKSPKKSEQIHGQLRILQFNILADGLSGLREDLGAFSRVKAEDMRWNIRKDRLLSEILQYSPDVITLQECDHYYDFFLPELAKVGFEGLYAPKPASACLEVSDNSDGCCIFVRKSKIRFMSSETLTFALAKADVMDKNEVMEDDKQIRAQNQVALVAICDFVSNYDPDKPPKKKSPPVIIATTHLKATKTEVGESYRARQALQLLDEVYRVAQSLKVQGNPAAIIVTGDLNTAPSRCSTGYAPRAYASVKKHPLNLRSVLNDDVPTAGNGVLSSISQLGAEDTDDTSAKECSGISNGVWTTWKGRIKKGSEKVIKHCIDYILYAPPLGSGPGVRATSILDLYSDDYIEKDLLPSALYPSDHLSIAAELQIVEILQDK